jgi:EmrB/QacA subfamily drug resistance transporter
METNTPDPDSRRSGSSQTVKPSNREPASVASSQKDDVDAQVPKQESGQRKEQRPQDDTEAPESPRDVEGGDSHAEESPPQRSKFKLAMIMLSLCICVLLAALDITIVTTALPTIAEVFQSAAGFTWIGSAYLIASAAGTPIWGKISDIFGRKPMLLLANLIFLLGSALAGGAQDMNMLIAARAVQGIGGGGLIVLVNIVISDLFAMRDRGQYFGMIGGVWALASSLGPIVGGLLTQKVSWRWAFYINLPLDGAAFIILLFVLDLHTPKTALQEGLRAVDWLGSLVMVGGTVMLLLGLEMGGVTFPWNSATIISLIVFGVVTLVVFFLVEYRVALYPLIPLDIFSKRANLAPLGVCFLHAFVFISASYFLPLYFQAVLNATPILSGVYLLPTALSLSFISAMTGIFIRKWGSYRPWIWGGMAIMTLGFGLFIDLKTDSSWAKIILYQIVQGIGVGPNFQAPLIALQSQVAVCFPLPSLCLYSSPQSENSILGPNKHWYSLFPNSNTYSRPCRDMFTSNTNSSNSNATWPPPPQPSAPSATSAPQSPSSSAPSFSRTK